MQTQGPNRRIQRVEKEIREIVATHIVTRVPEINSIVVVSRVIVSRDLRKAKVLVHSMSGLEESRAAVEILKHYASEIQSKIAAEIRMRYCPKIEFIADEKYEDVLRVQNLLEEIAKERSENQGTAV